MEDGDCALLIPSVPSCVPSCGSGAACVRENVCQRYPTALDAGTVRLAGLRGGGASEPVTLTSVANTYQRPAGLGLAYPPFSEGDAITLMSAGSANVAPFTVTSAEIAPLALAEGTIARAPGSPTTLAWTPPGPMGAGARVRGKLDISHHGGSRGMITCETADDGSLAIAAPLVSGLIALGVAGFPSVVVTRERTASAPSSTGPSRSRCSRRSSGTSPCRACVRAWKTRTAWATDAAVQTSRAAHE
jgi:hypothetical protein